MKNVWGYYVYFPKEQLEDYLKLDFQEYLNIYYSETPEHWFVLKKNVNIAFAADTDEKKAEVLKNDVFMTEFDYSLMHEKYSLLCTMSLPFDDDILRWVAFLYGYNRYFEKIGNPPLKLWLNSNNFNHPFDEPPSENYFNNMGLLELASTFEHGQNDFGDADQYGGFFAKELHEMIVAGRKPENVTQVHWDDMRQEIIDAATTEKP